MDYAALWELNLSTQPSFLSCGISVNSADEREYYTSMTVWIEDRNSQLWNILETECDKWPYPKFFNFPSLFPNENIPFEPKAGSDLTEYEEHAANLKDI